MLLSAFLTLDFAGSGIDKLAKIDLIFGAHYQQGYTSKIRYLSRQSTSFLKHLKEG